MTDQNVTIRLQREDFDLNAEIAAICEPPTCQIL